MLFATGLYFGREMLHWGRLPDALALWLQNAGGVSAVGIGLVLLARALQRDPHEFDFWNLPPRLRFMQTVLKYAIIVSGLGYLTLATVWMAKKLGVPGLDQVLLRTHPALPATIGDWILTISGLLALLVAMTPILVDLATRIHGGRIWAITRLSWKEAVRGRVIWVFGAMALVFLFADWFVPHKAEDQVRNYVRVVYWSMTPLFLVTAGLLGSFSIPNDVKSNTIHTIVTKPVEKFEIVLGRFLGYAALLTVGLFAVAGLSLIYVERGVNEEAKQESYKARVPIYGGLHFVGTANARKGEDVGREWTPRSYIKGTTRMQREPFRQFAVYDFIDIPADVAQREAPIIFEFTFDVFRLSKGEEGEGISCTFTFADVSKFSSADSSVQAKELDGKSEEMKKEREKRTASGGEDVDQALAAKYRIYQTSERVTDYHTQAVTVPAKVFQELVAEASKRNKGDRSAPPALRVFVNVDTAAQAQMVGVSQGDFYLLAYERSFWQNFLKGVIGMWCTHMLVLGVALACSAYLSAVISFLTTFFLFLAGMFVDYLREIAERRMDGGGPFESIVRITTQRPTASPMDPSPTTSMIKSLDSFFSWWVGQVLNLIPDIGRHDLHQFVANGFDIGWVDVLFLDNALPLAGFLLPWAILAYYLMKYREIANPT